MKKTYELEKHPNIVGRKEMLDPNQSGLLVNRQVSIRKRESGERFESEISERIRKEFANGILINNAYFETGRYLNKLYLYESVQIDHILIADTAVFCIEDKYIDDSNREISGNAHAKHWRVKNTRGKVTTETNGLKQNYGHLCLLKEIFEREGINIPIFQITVVGGLSREKIKVQQFIDANLISEDEVEDRINYLLDRRSNDPMEQIDVKKVFEVLQKWMCKFPEIEKLHLVYLRNRDKNCLPKRCKGKKLQHTNSDLWR